MKKVVVLLVCVVIVLVWYKVLDRSGIESPNAVELYKKACDGGNMLGCRNLGVMSEKGKLVEKD